MRCVNCPYKRENRKLEYYPYPYCSINGREINYDLCTHNEKPEWCPKLDEWEENENEK